MENRIKILFFLDEIDGGIYTFLYNVIKFLKDDIDAHLLCLDNGKESFLDVDFIKMGAKVYKLKEIWISKPSDFYRLSKALDDFFIEHNDYDIVHLNSSSKNFLVLKKAKKYGINIRISHSHVTDFQSKSFIKKFIGRCFKPLLKKYTTDYFACSEIAGKWLFGKKILNTNRFYIIPNAIDIEKFKYNIVTREKIRNILGVENSFVVGDVGRFVYQKNYLFLIDIFKEIINFKPDAYLIILGDGPLMDNIKSKVALLGLSDRVKFLGFKNDQYKYFQAMDAFVSPSLFEGFGIALLEAQASGLPCFVSANVVPNEVKVTKLLQYISLKKTAKQWAEIIVKNSNIKRKDILCNVSECGYDIKSAFKVLLKIYRDLIK